MSAYKLAAAPKQVSWDFFRFGISQMDFCEISEILVKKYDFGNV